MLGFLKIKGKVTPEVPQNSMEATQVSEMPKSKAQAKVTIEVGVPKILDDEITQLALADGWNPTEFYRMLIVDGLAAYAEKSNKRLVNKQLRSRLGVNDNND